MKQWSQKQFFNVQKCQFNILRNSLQSYKYLRHEKYFLPKIPYVIVLYIGIGIIGIVIGGYKKFHIGILSVLADLLSINMKKNLSVVHWIDQYQYFNLKPFNSILLFKSVRDTFDFNRTNKPIFQETKIGLKNRGPDILISYLH